MANLQIAVKAGGGRMDDIVQMRIYVTDLSAYKKQLKEIGKVWHKFLGGYYPAMTMVEVKQLFDEKAKVEIEAIAVLPLPRDPDDREIEAEDLGMKKSAPPAPAPVPAPKPAAPPAAKKPSPPPPKK
jgi:hypothetical protein